MMQNGELIFNFFLEKRLYYLLMYQILKAIKMCMSFKKMPQREWVLANAKKHSLLGRL